MRNFIWIFITGVVLISGCNNDEPEDQAKLDLIGTWTATEVSVGITVNGTPLLQWIQDALDLSDTEAQGFAELFIQELASSLSGTATFNADNSYSLQLGNDPVENGTWLLSNNNQILILTQSNNETSELEVITLNATTLKLGFEETETDDLDDDGTDDELVLNLSLTFEK